MRSFCCAYTSTPRGSTHERKSGPFWERQQLPDVKTNELEFVAEEEHSYQYWADAFLADRLGYPGRTIEKIIYPRPPLAGGSGSGTLSPTDDGPILETRAEPLPEMARLAQLRLDQLERLRQLQQEAAVSGGRPGTLSEQWGQVNTSNSTMRVKNC